MARPNAAENNAIANTPASAVTVIGARARRSRVIPLPNTAHAHRPGHPATGGQHVRTPHPQQYCGHTSFWHLLRFSDSRQIPMRCQFALRKLSVVSAHKLRLRSLSANANKGLLLTYLFSIYNGGISCWLIN